MVELKGIVASPGIVMGKVYRFDNKISIPNVDISSDQVALEMERLGKAVDKASRELSELKDHNYRKLGKEERKVIDSHSMMINDPELHDSIHMQLKEKKKNVEWVLLQVIDSISTKLKESDDEYLRERTSDLLDVAQRILKNLMNEEIPSLADINEEVILVAHSLLPSDVLEMSPKVMAFATDMGGITSHIAILAKSFELPAVLGLSKISESAVTGDFMILDGIKGLVIINPDNETRNLYKEVRIQWAAREKELLRTLGLPNITTDGEKFLLNANIEVPEEAASALAHGADNIGLFRSEFLFIHPKIYPSENEQYQAYSSVLKKMKNRFVIIRTLDLGGDKIAKGARSGFEENPILGWRAVRYYLSRPEIFKTQMRALFRASVHGNLKIMFPMISGLAELENILGLTEEVKQDLRKQKVRFDENIPIGIMIEVPSAAITADDLAKKVDFFSIGTNDLIQYTIAVDRGNERVAYLYEQFHPAIIGLIKKVIDSAKKHNIDIEMCGEMAGHPQAVCLLLGMGLRHFSMSSLRIPQVKQVLRSLSLEELQKMAKQALKLTRAKDVEQYITEWMETKIEFKTY
ncbi:MAG: phosphoenolpyruvate--protein phosphotransferase [Spirochaetales bacterium]|nr:phosphoenolpyruvate--protein phosphotransferase [Spirochaetales bacterium]